MAVSSTTFQPHPELTWACSSLHRLCSSPALPRCTPACLLGASRPAPFMFAFPGLHRRFRVCEPFSGFTPSPDLDGKGECGKLRSFIPGGIFTNLQVLCIPVLLPDPSSEILTQEQPYHSVSPLPRRSCKVVGENSLPLQTAAAPRACLVSSHPQSGLSYFCSPQRQSRLSPHSPFLSS